MQKLLSEALVGLLESELAGHRLKMILLLGPFRPEYQNLQIFFTANIRATMFQNIYNLVIK